MNQVGNIEIIEAESDFKRVHKNIINNHNIDCLTLGIFVRILTLGRKWKLNINGLSSHLCISDKKTRDSIKLLESYGFVTRYPVKDQETGKFKGWNYKFHAVPVSEEEKTSAGQRTYQKTDTPLNGQDGLPTTPLSDKAETGGDINSKPKELLDLNNNKLKKENNIKIDYDLILSEWSNICKSLAQPRMLNAKRKDKIRLLLENNNANVDDLIKCFKIISVSSFCHGDGKDKWKASFDWLINDTKSCFNRLLEGGYTTSRDETYKYNQIMSGNYIVGEITQQKQPIERNYDEEF